MCMISYHIDIIMINQTYGTFSNYVKSADNLKNKKGRIPLIFLKEDLKHQFNQACPLTRQLVRNSCFLAIIYP